MAVAAAAVVVVMAAAVVVVVVIKLRQIWMCGCVLHVGGMGEWEMHTKFWLVNLKEGDHLRNVGIDGRYQMVSQSHVQHVFL
jgi:hypothetical protein